jgi:hypothetical protein
MPARLLEITAAEDQYQLKLKETKSCPTAPYCALSYCWGGEQSLKSTLETYGDWLGDVPWSQLPQSLRDAVIACSKLGIKYLWVDAFCIIQDDEDDKAIEIAGMTDVYRNSYLTIAASRATNVREGFLHTRTATQYPQDVFKVAYQPRLLGRQGCLTLIRTTIEPEPLDKRGWTLQERLLSPRTLEFGSRQLRFICQHNPRGLTDGWRLWPESNDVRQDNLEHVAILQADDDSPQSLALSRTFLETVETWYRLIEVYSHRSLTVPEDRILAISGIAMRYGRVLNDKYFAGHWRSTFARSLYWEASEPTRVYTRPRRGPTWSWTSIDGPVKFPRISDLERHKPHIVAVQVPLKIEAHPYGAIHESAARLTVKARMSPAVLDFKPGLFGRVNTYASGISGNAGIFTTEIKVDCLEEARQAKEENNAVFLELSSSHSDNEWSTRGLIARGYGEKSFLRIGTFIHSENRGQRSSSTWDHMVETQLDWFGSDRAEIYDIL